MQHYPENQPSGSRGEQSPHQPLCDRRTQVDGIPSGFGSKVGGSNPSGRVRKIEDFFEL